MIFKKKADFVLGDLHILSLLIITETVLGSLQMRHLTEKTGFPEFSRARPVGIDSGFKSWSMTWVNRKR